MPKVALLTVLLASLAPAAAWHATTMRVARSRAAVRMVDWAQAPPHIQWAQQAWNQLGLDAHSLERGNGCYVIPAQLSPDPARQWYFCSTAAANEQNVDCLELPMVTAGRTVYICSTPLGARPTRDCE